MQAEIHKNGTENGQFPALFGLKIAKNSAFFSSKVLNRTNSQDVFEGCTDFKIFRYIRCCSKFRESYMPSTIRIRVNALSAE
jgi:hypothetical protein